MSLQLSELYREVEHSSPLCASGKITAAFGSTLECDLQEVTLGELCYIDHRSGESVPAQVVAFHERGTQLAPFAPLDGIRPGATVRTTGEPLLLHLPQHSNGTVLNCFGEELEDSSVASPRFDHPIARHSLSIEHPAPSPLHRAKIRHQLHTGIRAIDFLCPLGYGQRIGLFAGPGVGKSTLLGMMAKGADVDRVVIALVGERGREVQEFLEEALGERGRSRSTVVVSTSNESAARRKTAAFAATRIAEYYRDQGERVLLLVDSLTRTARAIRDMSLAAGELPVRQGYTGSVFDELPRLIERAGTSSSGSITAIYTLLTSYDDSHDVLSEEVKSLLDGHIVLSPEIAQKGIYPAIDITRSVSRLTSALFSSQEIERARTLGRLLARLKRDKDLTMLGGTPDGELSLALRYEQEIETFLTQTADAPVPDEAEYEQFRKFLDTLVTKRNGSKHAE